MAWQLTALPDDSFQWVDDQTGQTAPYDPTTGTPPALTQTQAQQVPAGYTTQAPANQQLALGADGSYHQVAVNPETGKLEPFYSISSGALGGASGEGETTYYGFTPNPLASSVVPGDYQQVSKLDQALDFPSTISNLASDPAAVLAAATTGSLGGMTGAEALTGGDVGAGLTTDLAALSSAGVGAGVSALGAPAAVSGAAGGATGGAISSGGDPEAILTGAGLGALGATLYSGAGDTTGTAPSSGSEPVQTAALDTGAAPDVTAPTTSSSPTLLADAGGGLTMTDVTAPTTGPLMPPAVPEADPTFGGALAPTAAGVFESPLATPTPLATPAPVAEPTKVESTPLAAADTTAAAAPAPTMPAAVPEPDPTFGGALAQTAPAASPSAPTTYTAPQEFSSPLSTATLSSPSMPAAVPEPDPTFGGALTQTAPDVFTSPLSTSSVAPATVTGNDTTGSDTTTPAAGGVGPDGSADTNTNTGGADAGAATQDTGGGFTDTTGGDTSAPAVGGVGPTGSADTNTNTGGGDTGAATQSAGGLTDTTGTSSDTAPSTGSDATLDATGFPAPTSTLVSGGGGDATLAATGFPGPTSGTGGTGGGGDGLGSEFADYSDTGPFDRNASAGVFDNQGNPLYESPRPGPSARDIGDVITKYGPLSLGVAGILNQQNAGRAAAQKLAQVGSEQRAIAGDLLAKYKSGELNAADKLAIDEWQRGAIAQVRQYYANAHQSDSSAAVDAEARVNARAEAMKEAARQGLLKMGLDTLNITDRYQAAAASAEYNADQQMLANAINFMNAYGSWLRGAPKSTSSRRSEDVAAATGNVTGPDISVPDYAQNDYSTPPGNG